MMSIPSSYDCESPPTLPQESKLMREIFIPSRSEGLAAIYRRGWPRDYCGCLAG